MRFFATLLCLTFMMAMPITAADEVRLDKLAQGDAVHGFRVKTVYLNDAGAPLGARFIHNGTGFTLDLLQIESVPQGYTWVRSIPVSDQGEPHTQEHLLLGKGTTGRAFASLETMWLSGSTAFTQQWRTNYPFNTTAGPEVFFRLFARQLDALLHPNYTDEEIRREVRNFGVTANPDGTLRLEEKGTVYNEMMSSSGNPYRQLFRAGGHLVFGAQHPLSYNSGGEPSGIRTMKPEDIRNFHKANYYLANMGTIVSFPRSVPVAEILTRVDEIVRKSEPKGMTRAGRSLKSLPAPQPSPAGTIAYTEYPHRNDQQPSPMGLWWPASRDLNADEKVLADLFFANLASDATTNLYKLFIDSKSRKMDIGARQIFSSVDEDPGNMIYIAFADVAPSNFTDEKVNSVRTIVTDEIARIAALTDDSAELKEFNGRIASRISELQRDLAKFVNSPPGFGFRSGGSSWVDQLTALEQAPGFRKSVTLKPQIEFVQKQLASGKNVWGGYLARWQVTGVTPYAVAAHPSPQLIQREEAERLARANEEAARLARVYKVADAQQAITRYRSEYDAAGAKIEQEAKKLTPPEFIKNPPMTLDDQLQFQARTLEGVAVVSSRFDNMSSAMTGVALRLDGVPPAHLRYLSLLPALLTRVGVIENGKPVPYEEMSERLRNEILSLDANFSTNQRTERVELAVRGAGIGASEARRAIEWMGLVLHSPDWRPENLPRIRDVVDQELSRLRNTMQGSEESWVNNPAGAYRMQHNPLFLATDSFLTRSHNALRLRWLLKEASQADGEAVASLLGQLAERVKGKPRAEIKALLASPAALENLSPSAQTIATDALKDLDLTLIEIPDSSLTADFAYLCAAMRDDLLTAPADTLTAMNALRASLLERGKARMFTVGNTDMEKELTPSVSAFAGRLGSPAAAPRTAASTQKLIDARLLARDPEAKNPQQVGLLAPNMKGGVIITSVPSAQFSDFGDREQQLDYLASRLFAGYGAHGVFLKTIGAGLAYSNGMRGSIASGRIGYYAERTPELPQTVRFVIGEVKGSPRDTKLADYVVAQVFGENRGAGSYESRAEGMATDLADGQPSEMVRKFRQSILELRKDPKLGQILFDRKDAVYARFIPGYGAKVAGGGVYFVIGPDKQLDAWDQYVRSAGEGGLQRLYGRDFWMP